MDDREEVIITRAGHEPVVIVALDDYESLKETAYLLKSPENAPRLLASIDRASYRFAAPPSQTPPHSPGALGRPCPLTTSAPGRTR